MVRGFAPRRAHNNRAHERAPTSKATRVSRAGANQGQTQTPVSGSVAAVTRWLAAGTSPTVFTPARNARSAASTSTRDATFPTAVTSTGSAAGAPAPRTLPASSVRRPCADLRDLSASGWLPPARWPTIAPRSVANRATPSRTAPLTAVHTSWVLAAYGSAPRDGDADERVGAAAAG